MKTGRWHKTIIGSTFITLCLLNLNLSLKAKVIDSEMLRTDGYYYAVLENSASYIIFYENGLTFGNPMSRIALNDANVTQAETEMLVSNKIIYLSNVVYNVSDNNFDKYSLKNDTLLVSILGGRAGDKTLTEYYFIIDHPESLTLVKQVNSGSSIQTENKTKLHNVEYKFVKLDIKIRTNSVSCNFKKKDKTEPVVNYSDGVSVDGYYYAVSENKAKLLVFYREGVCYGDMEQYVPLPDSALSAEKTEKILNDYLIYVFRQTATYPPSYKYLSTYTVNNDSLVIEKYKSERKKTFYKYFGRIDNPHSFTFYRQEYSCDDGQGTNKDIIESELKFKFVKFYAKPYITMPKN